MEWTDEGIVLGVRRHGESSAIVELLTRGHGRHLGLVRGGDQRPAGRPPPPPNTDRRARRGRGAADMVMLELSFWVSAVGRARLDELNGTYAIEDLNLRQTILMIIPLAV